MQNRVTARRVCVCVSQAGVVRHVALACVPMIVLKKKGMVLVPTTPGSVLANLVIKVTTVGNKVA